MMKRFAYLGKCKIVISLPKSGRGLPRSKTWRRYERETVEHKWYRQDFLSYSYRVDAVLRGG